LGTPGTVSEQVPPSAFLSPQLAFAGQKGKRRPLGSPAPVLVLLAVLTLPGRAGRREGRKEGGKGGREEREGGREREREERGREERGGEEEKREEEEGEKEEREEKEKREKGKKEAEGGREEREPVT